MTTFSADSHGHQVPSPVEFAARLRQAKNRVAEKYKMVRTRT